MSDIVYTRSINELRSYPSHAGQTDVVVYVLWTLYGKKDGLTAQVQTNTPITFKDGVTFVPYESLTPEIVFSWVDAATAPEEMDAKNKILAGEITRQETPPLVVLPPPWNV